MITEELVTDLQLLPHNPRKISKEEFDRLCRSIRDDADFLRMRPVLVNLNSDTAIKTVYAGNQRVLAAQSLRWPTIPCIVETDLDEETMKRRAIIDNQHNGEWDYYLLQENWDMDMLFDMGFIHTDFPFPNSEDIYDTKSQDETREKCNECGRPKPKAKPRRKG